MTAPLSSLADPADERFTEAPEIVVERVAEALFRTAWSVSRGRSLSDETHSWQAHYRRLAAAAIAAMDPS